VFWHGKAVIFPKTRDHGGVGKIEDTMGSSLTTSKYSTLRLVAYVGLVTPDQ